MVVENKMVDASIEAWISNIKKVLIRALPSGVDGTNNNVNNFSVMLVNWVSSNIDLVINSGIVKILTETGIVDAKKILIRVFLDRIKDANNIATG